VPAHSALPCTGQILTVKAQRFKFHYAFQILVKAEAQLLAAQGWV
jgi:hypothetical protein